MMLAHLKKHFSARALGINQGNNQVIIFILGVIAIIGGIQGAWGDDRPIGGFFEGAIASVLYMVVPIGIFYIAFAFGASALSAYDSKLLGWVFGLSAFLLFGFAIMWIVSQVPGVGWRFEAMLDSGEY